MSFEWQVVELILALKTTHATAVVESSGVLSFQGAQHSDTCGAAQPEQTSILPMMIADFGMLKHNMNAGCALRTLTMRRLNPRRVNALCTFKDTHKQTAGD